MILRSGKSCPNSGPNIIKNEQLTVEIVDSEISFHFNVKQKQSSEEIKHEVNTVDSKFSEDWLKTM